jgi:glycosyltransferase involved in cell wall biosynthesis
MHKVSIITATLNRPSLNQTCESVDNQTFTGWHHYVLGDGLLPEDYMHPNRTTIGFSHPIGAEEPSADMPDGTPNPIYRWALHHFELGEFVCFIDDDNAYNPFFLQEMVEALMNSDMGIAICMLEDLRFVKGEASQSLYRIDDDPIGPPLDGYPECGRCDNSGFLTYSQMAKSIGFPKATLEIDAVQDYQFIRTIAEKHGWIRIPKKLVQYGVGQNTPPPKSRIS